LASTKTKKFGIFFADKKHKNDSSFFWYESQSEMLNEISKNFCTIYFTREDVNRTNDFLKNFNNIESEIKKLGLSSKQILEKLEALLNKFKVVTFYDSENSYIGPGLSLWISQDLFPMQLRGTFRSSLYGFYLENNIDLGRAPIEFKETIRFEEFLEGPIKIA
jgi:hypothetical protein